MKIFVMGSLLLASSAFSMTLTEARQAFQDRQYTGAPLESLKEASKTYKNILGRIAEIDMAKLRDQVTGAMVDNEGFKFRNALKTADVRLQKILESPPHSIQNLYADLQDENNLRLIKEYAEINMFLGDAHPPKDKFVRAGLYNNCVNVTDLAARAFGIFNLHTLKEDTKRQKALLQMIENLSPSKKTALAQVLYMRAGCLGSWGLTKVVSKITAGERVPEIQSNLLLLTSSGLKSVYDYGPYRVLGRVASKSPLRRLGKNPVLAMSFLREAYAKTIGPQAISRNNFNSTYYADAMYTIARRHQSAAKKLKRKGKKAEAKEEYKKMDIQFYKSIRLLRLIIQADQAQLNNTYLPENNRGVDSAKELLATILIKRKKAEKEKIK